MIPDVVLSVLAGVVGGAAWIRLHRHDDLVPRTEFDLVLRRLDEIREDLRDLRIRLDETAGGG